MLRIHKENNEDLDFVIGCLYSQVISLAEVVNIKSEIDIYTWRNI